MVDARRSTLDSAPSVRPTSTAKRSSEACVAIGTVSCVAGHGSIRLCWRRLVGSYAGACGPTSTATAAPPPIRSASLPPQRPASQHTATAHRPSQLALRTQRLQLATATIASGPQLSMPSASVLPTSNSAISSLLMLLLRSSRDAPPPTCSWPIALPTTPHRSISRHDAASAMDTASSIPSSPHALRRSMSRSRAWALAPPLAATSAAALTHRRGR